jgi:poly(A) polymerase
LAAVLEDGRAAADRLRLSNADRDRLAALTGPNPIDPGAGAKTQRVLLYRLGATLYRDFALLAGAATVLTIADAWAAPTLPIGGSDVRRLDIPAGPRVGRLLKQVEVWWIEGDFQADRAACLARLAALAVLLRV